MKKVIIAFALALLVVGFKAEAAAPVYGNGDPYAVTQSWGLTGHQSTVVPAGSVIVDEGGIKTVCGKWEKNGCIDISKTASYRNDMLKIARTLIETNQVSRFPAFGGWVALAR